VEFGQPGFDHVPISVAAQASSALPGLFPPVEIDGRYYLDGALKKTLHAGVALKEGAQLVLCLNPIVPFDDSVAMLHAGDPKKLVEGGLPVVLSQTFRALVHSRMQVGMRQYDSQYSKADVVL
jgi:NTE family protein